MTCNLKFCQNANLKNFWAVRDSVLELCANEQRLVAEQNTKIAHLPGSIDDAAVRDWLGKDPGNGFIRIYPPDLKEFSSSFVFPCDQKTSVSQIYQQLGVTANVLHLQMNGGLVRRLELEEHPLIIQGQFLLKLGYSDTIRIQEEGVKEDLAYLIKFFFGRPLCQGEPPINLLESSLQVRIVGKGGVVQQPKDRWCILYSTKIHIYKDESKKEEATVVPLVGGQVEVLDTGNLRNCIRIVNPGSDKSSVLLSFVDYETCLLWFNKCKKATEPLPIAADLSNCHLEYLPDVLFINEKLAVLILKHNLLKDRINKEDTKLGWMDDIGRFKHLACLNLAYNSLDHFPTIICHIPTLTDLNLSSNRIKELPTDIKLLENLKFFHLGNNHLFLLPDQILHLKRLSLLDLSFNRFTSVPMVVAQLTDIRYTETQNVTMAGNQIKKLAEDVLAELKYVRKLDLRMNLLSLPPNEMIKLSVLTHLSHLDVRDNQISEMNLKSVRTLKFLSCERNCMTSLTLNGNSFKVLHASCNCLDQLVISPQPKGLIHFDVSNNCLTSLPDWICECYELKRLFAQQNYIKELPAKLFSTARSLLHVNLSHNHLRSLPEEIGQLDLSELQVHHNFISFLPRDLLSRLNGLVIFNSSRSSLQSLPPLGDVPELNFLRELYLSGNSLGNDVLKVVSGYTMLRVLNLERNEISELYQEEVSKMRMLEELNVSSNQLKHLPDCLGKLPHLEVLRCHSNFLTSLPKFVGARALKVLDVGHNQLTNVILADLMSSKLHLLDLELNDQLKVDRRDVKTTLSKKTVHVVDSSGQNKTLPGLSRKSDIPETRLWKVGFSSSGSVKARNKLCIHVVKLLEMNERKDCLVGMFDGGRSGEIPKQLVKNIREIVQDELNRKATDKRFMKYAFLTAHKSLKLRGHKMGVSAALCHISKSPLVSSPSPSKGGSHPFMSSYVLTVGSVGDVEAVLCRKGEAVLLTRKSVVYLDQEETRRVCSSDGVVTDVSDVLRCFVCCQDGKVDGVTSCTRQLGHANLYPSVIPDPFCSTMPLQVEDEFIIIGSSSFWKYMSYREAVEAAYGVSDPVVASKHLRDMAECYGCKESVAVLVVRLKFEPGSLIGKLKSPRKRLSANEVEAAIRHDVEVAQKKWCNKDVTKK